LGEIGQKRMSGGEGKEKWKEGRAEGGEGCEYWEKLRAGQEEEVSLAGKGGKGEGFGIREEIGGN